jgi:hypothetical protein
MASPEFFAMVDTAGMLQPYGAQQKAIATHLRVPEADDWRPRKTLPNGDAVVDFLKDDEERPVGRALFTKAGQVEPYVTEVLA